MSRKRGAIVIGLALVLSATLVLVGPRGLGTLTPSMAWTVRPQSDPSWNDTFTNASYVAASAGVVIGGGNVTLLPSALERRGLVVPRGSAGSFDSNEAGKPTVLIDQGVYKMWYYGYSPSGTEIGYATSLDGSNWTKQGVVLTPTLAQEGSFVDYPEVLKLGGQFVMWYCGFDGTHYRIFAAHSANGVNWTKDGMVIDVGASGSPDDEYVSVPTVALVNSVYDLWYVGTSYSNPTGQVIMLAESSNGLNWTKAGTVLTASSSGLDDQRVLDPSVRYFDGKFEMIYAGTYAADGSQRLFYAESANGVLWQKRGLALNLGGVLETPTLAMPGILKVSPHVWDVYYTARGTSFQIFLSTLYRLGYARSTSIAIPSGDHWGLVSIAEDLPTGTSVQVSVLDAQTLQPLTGMSNLTSTTISLAAVNSTVHPSLALLGWLGGGFLSSPALDSWSVNWTAPSPPSGGGGTGGAGPSPGATQGLDLGAVLPWLLGGVVGALVAGTAIFLATRRKPGPPPAGPT